MLEKNSFPVSALYHAERLGGGLSLYAIRVPEDQFERVKEQVNAFPEVAHNYARDNGVQHVVRTGNRDTPAHRQRNPRDRAVNGIPGLQYAQGRGVFVGLKFEV